MNNIAIVGVGFVGGALFKFLKQKFNVLRYDPSKKFSCSKEDGFSGSCFPGDPNALISKMAEKGMEPIFQKMVWNLNKKVSQRVQESKI